MKGLLVLSTVLVVLLVFGGSASAQPEITIDSPQNASTTDTAPDLNLTTSIASNITYNWDGEGNITGCHECTYYNTTYGEYANTSEQNISAIWHFNENFGNTTYDDSGNSNTGTIVYQNWSTGRFGHGIYFNGSNLTYVTIPSSESINVTINFTEIIWFRPEEAEDWQVITSKGPQWWAGQMFMLSEFAGEVYCEYGDDNYFYTNNPVPLNLNEWVFCAVTYDGSYVRLYVNGTEVYNETQTGLLTYNNDPLVIGGGMGTDPAFNGTVDEYMIFDRVLSAEEIQQIYAKSLSDGKRNVTVYANDTAGNLNSTTRWFTVDTVAPYNITLNYPSNNSNISNTSITFNWTSYDATSNMSSNLTIDGVVNVSNIPTNNGTPTNWTVSGFSEGLHNWSITTWDDAGLSNTSSTYYFTVDTTLPQITINSPINETISDNTPTLNATIDETGEMWYSVDNIFNYTGTMMGTSFETNLTRYRVPINVSAGSYNRTDYSIEVKINFTKALEDLGVTGTFDENSTRVVEYDSSGKPLYEVPSHFRKFAGYNESINAYVTIVWIMNGTTPANTSRNYHVYFDVIENGIKSAPDYRTPNSSVSLFWTYNLSGNSQSTPTVADLDSDGKLEVILGSNSGGMYALFYNGSLMWNYTTGGIIQSSPAVADINNNGKLEIVFGSEDKKVYALNFTGGLLWNYTTGGKIYYSSPAIADINNDGSLEVVIGSDKIYALYGENGTQLWNYTTSGGADVSTPSIADIDNDGDLEVISGDKSNTLYVLYNNGSQMWNYSLPSGWQVWSSPAIADINNDGNLEIVVGSGNITYVLYNNGSQLWNYSNGTGGDVIQPTIADINNDGNLEIIVSMSSTNTIYALRSNGSVLWSYTANAWAAWGAGIADINNDGYLDVLAASDDYNLYALSNNGTLIWNYSVGGWANKEPTIADIDSDGNLEAMIASSNNNLSVLKVGRKWSDWKMFQHDLRHSGLYNYDPNPPNITQGDAEYGLPDGPHLVTVYANDTAGNLNSTIVFFTVDTTPPYQITLNYPGPNANISTRNVNFNWTSYDATSNMSSNLTINGVVNVSNIITYNGTPTNYTLAMPDGPHNWSITTWDDVGNTNTSDTYFFTVDTTPPSVTITSPVPFANLTSPSNLLNVTVTDATTDVNAGTVQYIFENSSGQFNEAGVPNIWTPILLYGVNADIYNTTFSAEAGLADGGYAIRVRANDTVNNQNSSEFVNITIDNTPPSITITSPESKRYDPNSAIWFNATISDALLDVNAGLVEYDGVNHTLLQSVNDTWYHYNASLPDGSYVARFCANDNLGTMGCASRSFTIGPAPVEEEAEVIPTPLFLTQPFTILTSSIMNDVILHRNLKYKQFYDAAISLAATLIMVDEYPEPSMAVTLGKPIKNLEGDVYDISATKILTKYTFARTLVIARGDIAVDSMAAIAYAKANNLPILLTMPGELPKVTLDAVKTLNPSKIIVIGGNVAVSEEVEAGLKDIASVERIWGATRYETAIELAKTIDDPSLVVITQGYNPTIDAVIISAAYKAPLIYVGSGDVPQTVKDYLVEHKDAKVLFVGVSEGVATEVESLMK